MYDGHDATALGLPYSLTLNGLIAAMATVNRAFLNAPLCSVIMQEMWIFFALEAERPASACRSRVIDIELFAKASTGAFGSLTFMARSRGTKYELSLCFSVPDADMRQKMGRSLLLRRSRVAVVEYLHTTADILSACT